MKIANPTKAFLLLVALICLSVLMGIGKVTPEAGLPIITAIVFYAIGNGVGHGTPVLERKNRDGETS